MGFNYIKQFQEDLQMVAKYDMYSLKHVMKNLPSLNYLMKHLISKQFFKIITPFINK